MLNFSEVNTLGNICNTTWGKSSTVSSPTMSIKTTISGDVLSVSYSTIVHFACEASMRQQVGRYEEESASITNDYMKKVKKEFKENVGRALKVKEVNTNDNVEIITTSPFSPRKTAYYRRVTSFKVD